VTRPVLVRLPAGWGLFVTVPPTTHGSLAVVYRVARERGAAAVGVSGTWSLDPPRGTPRRRATLLVDFTRPRTFQLRVDFSLYDRDTEEALRTLGGTPAPSVVLLYPSRADVAKAMRAVQRSDAPGFLRLGVAIDGVDGAPLRELAAG
jgi:hypothetical protein